MKLITRTHYSTDQRCLVETRQRRDGLWEVEGFRRKTESLPEEGSYFFMESALGLVLTDTQANAEKLALETLAALSGISNENMPYQVVVTEEEISDLVPEKGASDHREPAVLPEPKDERFKDMQSWGIDKDYKPERNPSLKDQDLVPRARIVLDKITRGGKSIYSVEVCDILILIGKSLELKGKPVDACLYWYNASEIANNPWLGGWGTVSIELLRDLKRKNKISDSQFEIIKPVPDLLREFISLSKKSRC